VLELGLSIIGYTKNSKSRDASTFYNAQFLLRSSYKPATVELENRKIFPTLVVQTLMCWKVLLQGMRRDIGIY